LLRRRHNRGFISRRYPLIKRVGFNYRLGVLHGLVGLLTGTPGLLEKRGNIVFRFVNEPGGFHSRFATDGVAVSGALSIDDGDSRRLLGNDSDVSGNRFGEFSLHGYLASCWRRARFRNGVIRLNGVNSIYTQYVSDNTCVNLSFIFSECLIRGESNKKYN
jgi:hypothetical protein